MARNGGKWLGVELGAWDRVAAGLVTLLAIVSGVLTFAGMPWWVITATGSAALWLIFAAVRNLDLPTPTAVLLTLVFAGAGTVMARGAWAIWPSNPPYSGKFIVIGDSPIAVGSLAPQQNTEGPLSINWDAGESVTVECITRDLERTNRRWYRVRSTPKVFLSDEQLTPSFAEPPGKPPKC